MADIPHQLPSFFQILNITVSGLSRTDNSDSTKVMFFNDNTNGHFNESLLFSKQYNSDEPAQLEEVRNITAEKEAAKNKGRKLKR